MKASIGNEMSHKYTPTIKITKKTNRPLNESRNQDDFGTAIYDSEYAVKDLGVEYASLIDACRSALHFSEKMKHDQEEIVNYSEAMSKELVRLNANPNSKENIEDVVFTVIEGVDEHERYSKNIQYIILDVEEYQKEITKHIRSMKSALKTLNATNRDVKKYAKKL